MTCLEPILQTRQLAYTYSQGTPFQRDALTNVDFEAYPGEYLGVIGHTGSGKSTLIQHFNGLLKPTKGKVLFCGRDIWETPEITRQTRFQVGLAFQYPEYQLFEETVYRDIAFGPTNMQLPPENVDRRVRRAAEFVGLSPDILELSPFELSGGQKRRVAIAGIIAMEPAVLILDEPTAGLDPAGRDEILGNIRDYHDANGSTIILVSHSMEDVAAQVDRLVVVNDGAISICGTPHEVFAHGQQLRQMGLGIPQVTEVFQRLRELGVDIDPAVYTVGEARAAILARLRRKGGM